MSEQNGITKQSNKISYSSTYELVERIKAHVELFHGTLEQLRDEGYTVDLKMTDKGYIGGSISKTTREDYVI